VLERVLWFDTIGSRAVSYTHSQRFGSHFIIQSQHTPSHKHKFVAV